MRGRRRGQRRSEGALLVRVPVVSLSRAGMLVVPAVVLAGFTAIGQPLLGLPPAAIVLLTLTLFHRRLLALIDANRAAQLRTRERSVESRRLRARLRSVEGRCAQQQRCLETAREITAEAVARLVEMRDPITGAHVARLAQYTRILATELRADGRFTAQLSAEVVAALPRASMLHDVGKVAVPDELLLKPGPLDAEEFAVVKRHTTSGAHALQELLRRDPENRYLRLAQEVALYHHERWDGTGYPFGLRGEEIPASARIVALADVYDALTSERPYKPAYTHEATRAHLLAQARAHFDPAVVDAFVRTERQFLAIRAALPDAVPARATWLPSAPRENSPSGRTATIHPFKPVATA